VRMVAVMGTKRQDVIPDTPTFAELGVKGFEDLPYYGIFAPKGTPTATIEDLVMPSQKCLKCHKLNNALLRWDSPSST